MKPLLSVALLLAGLFLPGCATEPDPLVQEAGSDFQRGITGQGTLYQQNKEDDPFIGDGASR